MMASFLALGTPVTSDGAPVLDSPSSGTGAEASRFAELLAALGKAAQAGNRTRSTAAATARLETAKKTRPSRKSDGDGRDTDATESGNRPPSAKKAEKRAAVAAAAPGTPALQAVVVEATTAGGGLPEGAVLQAMLAGVDAPKGTAPDPVHEEVEVSPASGPAGRLSPHVALPEPLMTAATAVTSRAAGGSGGIHLPGGPTESVAIPGSAVAARGPATPVAPQGAAATAALALDVLPAGAGVSTAAPAVVGEALSPSLPGAAPQVAPPAGTTTRTSGRSSVAPSASQSRGAAPQPQPEGGFEPVNLDTLWLFRGDPAYAAAMASPVAEVPGLPMDGGSPMGAAVTGDKPLVTGKPGRHEDSRTGQAEVLAPAGSVALSALNGGEPSPASAGAASPVVDGTAPAALPGHVGREVARWMQGHTRPLPEGGSLLELRLKPAALGSITIRMAEQNGQLSAQITVSDAGVGHALVREMPRMADELARHGVSLNSVSVGTSGAGPDSGGAQAQHSYQGSGSSRSTRHDFTMESLIQDSAPAVPVSPLAGGGLVNVRA